MEDTPKGILILAVTFLGFVFVLTGCMERRLKKIGQVVRQIEDDTKYVN